MTERHATSEEVSDRERSFFDRSYASGARDSVKQFYVVNEACSSWYQHCILSRSRDKRVLEYGCGEGSSAFALAGGASEVVGIDISHVAIAHARQRAHDEGAGNLRFFCMDAQNTEFDSASFDLVCGSGILHHLDVRRSMAEIARVLRPDGAAVFVEPMGHNPAINLFRRLTPALRSPDEHPLVAQDLRLIRRSFGQVDFRFFNLFSLAAYFVRGRSAFRPVLHRLDELDRRAFLWAPPLALMSWFVVLVLGMPNAARPRDAPCQ